MRQCCHVQYYESGVHNEHFNKRLARSLVKLHVPSVGTEARIAYNNRNNTTNEYNKAPRRTLLFGSFVSFVMTVSAERPKHLQTDVLRIPEQHVLSFLSIRDWSLSLENYFKILKSLVRVCIKLIKRLNGRKTYLFYTSTVNEGLSDERRERRLLIPANMFFFFCSGWVVAIVMDVLECSVRFCVRLVGEKHQHKHRPK